MLVVFIIVKSPEKTLIFSPFNPSHATQRCISQHLLCRTILGVCVWGGSDWTQEALISFF